MTTRDPAAPRLRIAAISLHTSPLAVPGSADAGGMNVVILEQARALAALGHRVDLITRRADPDSPAVREVSPGIRLLTLDAGPARALAKSAMDPVIPAFRDALAELLAGAGEGAESYHILHAHHWFSGVAALPVARAHGIPLAQSYHSVAAPQGADSLGAGEPAESPGRIAGERETARGADLVIAVSAAEERTIRERYDVPAERIAVVRPGVDTRIFHPAADAPAAGEGQSIRLLFAARLQPLKAPDLAIRTLAALAEPADAHPAGDARLVLAGGTSQDFAAYDASLRDLAAELGVAERVQAVGSVSREELASLMRGTDVLLLTSWSETFGLVALEAQASGTPVIAWRGAGGIAEAIGEGGTVLADRDPEHWAQAVREIVADPAERERRSRAARAFAEQRTWGTSAENLLAAYGRMMRADHDPAPAAAPDPWALLDSARTVLTLHAHPDDESLSTGALLAHLAERGAHVVLLTATHGEEGEIIPGAIPEGDERSLDAVRMDELDGAAAALGVAERHMLGTAPAREGAEPRRYRDSGMRWVREDLAGPAESTGPEALTRRPFAEAVADAAALVRAVRPDVIVSYDDGGTYGHPDHVLVHHLAAALAERTGVPFVEVESYVENGEGAAGAGAGFVRRDVPEVRERLRAALGSHRTQLSVTGEADPEGDLPGRILIRLSGGQPRAVPLRVGARIHGG